MKKLFPKMKKPGVQPAPVTRDSAIDTTRDDELRKRRGGAADMLTGAGGAEAGQTGKTILG